MDKLDMEIVNEDINNHKDIINLKLKLKYENKLLTIGIVENIETGGEHITLVMLDNNKLQNKTTVFSIPDELLLGKFDDIIKFIIDHFT